MKTKNALILVHEYYPEDTRVKWQAEALAQEGYEVLVVCLKEKGQRFRDRVNNVNIVRLPIRHRRRANYFPYVFEYISFLSLSAFLITTISATRAFEVVQVASPPDILVFAAMVPKIRGAMVILDIHDSMPLTFKARSKASDENWLFKLLQKSQNLSMAFCDRIITVSQTLKEVILEQNPKTLDGKIAVVVNSVDENLVKGDAAIGERKFDRDERFTLIYHGKLIDEYRVEDILYALYSIKKTIDKQFVFHIYGKGPKWHKCEGLIKELGLENHVILHRFIEHRAVLNKVREADVGIVPLSDNEYADLAMPRKFLEYVFLGIPVIIPNMKTISRYFGEGAALFYDPGDIEDLAGKILAASANEEMRKVIAENARQQYESISFARMRKEYINVISAQCCK